MAGFLTPNLAIPAQTALVFAPFVLPLCAHVAWTDLSAMRISNRTVTALALVFVLLGPLLMPLDAYGWRLLTMVVTLGITMLFYAGGAMGAGDAKFIPAAAPFIAPDDVIYVLILFCALLITGFITHRLARATGLRRLAPGWDSWEVKSAPGTRARWLRAPFPMGFPLAGTLAFYLILALL
ncbi:prepilin peptidase [Pseudooceanicola sp. 200-1SW]|uniref:prepilin peptidase n=1 Tax=Pseudooceanicola sp. 200-1SW TaxID=3425949 RepID=UPI003D7F5968